MPKMQYKVKGTTFEVDDRYEVKKKIGQGAYGLICAATDRQKGDTVAVKKIANAFEDAIDCKRTLREIRLLQHFNHENVLNLRDIMLPPPGALEQWNDIYLALELMDTDLHYIIHSKQALTDDHIQYFIYQILRGLKAIHSAKVRPPPAITPYPRLVAPLLARYTCRLACLAGATLFDDYRQGTGGEQWRPGEGRGTRGRRGRGGGGRQGVARMEFGAVPRLSLSCVRLRASLGPRINCRSGPRARVRRLGSLHANATLPTGAAPRPEAQQLAGQQELRPQDLVRALSHAPGSRARSRPHVALPPGHTVRAHAAYVH